MLESGEISDDENDLLKAIEAKKQNSIEESSSPTKKNSLDITTRFSNKKSDLSLNFQPQGISRSFSQNSFRNHDINTEEIWIGPFIDIIYVATIYNISHLFTACGTNTNTGVLSASYFMIMFLTRCHLDYYNILYLSNDLASRLIHCIYALGLFVMTLNIAQETHEGKSYSIDDEYISTTRYLSGSTSSSSSDECFIVNNYSIGFGIAFIFTRCFLITLYSIAMVHSHHKHNKNQVFIICLKIVPFIFSSIIMCFIFGGYSPIIIFPLVAGMEFIIKFILEVFYDMSLEDTGKEMQARLGLFFMLILGESMLSLLTVAYNVNDTREAYLNLIFSFFLVFSTGMQFYDSSVKPIPHEIENSFHAMTNENRLNKAIYISLFCFAGYFMLIATIGLTAIYLDITSIGESSEHFELSLGLCVLEIIMLIMRGMHEGLGFINYINNETYRIQYRLLFAGVHMMLFALPISSKFVVFIHSMISALSILYESIYYHSTAFIAENETEKYTSQISEGSFKQIKSLFSTKNIDRSPRKKISKRGNQINWDELDQIDSNKYEDSDKLCEDNNKHIDENILNYEKTEKKYLYKKFNEKFITSIEDLNKSFISLTNVSDISMTEDV